MKLFLFTGLLILMYSCSNSKADSIKVDELNNKGVAKMDRQDYDGALIDFRDAMKYKDADNKSLANLYRNIAIVFDFKENLDSNKHYLRKAIDISEKDSYQFHLNTAELELLENKMESAISHLQEAEKKSNSKMEIYNNYALIYFGAYDEAYVNDEKAYDYSKKAFAENKQVALKDMLASAALSTERYDESIQLYNELSADFPSNMFFKFQLGTAKFLKGNEEEGEALMQYAAARDSECKEFYSQFFGE